MIGKRPATIDELDLAIRNLRMEIDGRVMAVGGAVGEHDLLSTYHGDTLAADAVQGDLIYAEGDNSWARLPLGANGYHLRSDGTDVAWVTPVAVLVGLSGAAGAAFSWSSQNLTNVGTIGCGTITSSGDVIISNGAVFPAAASGTGYSASLSTGLNYPYVDAFLDAVAGASWTGRLRFRTSSGGGALSDRMLIDHTGDVSVMRNIIMTDGATMGLATGPLMTFDDANNYLEITGCSVGIGQTTFGTNAEKVLALGTGVAPTTSPADCFQMFSKDVNGVADKAGAHIRNENSGVLIVPGVLIKTDTGSPAYNFEGMICINTNDNTVDMYADAGWRTLASW